MNAWTIGADIGAMLTGVAVLPAAVVWLARQLRGWRQAKSRTSVLLQGQSLRVGQSLYSPDGRTRFTLQADANMVVSIDGYGTFDDTATIGLGAPKCLALESDGSLILYNTDGEELWKQGPGAVRLEVQDNGHVCLYPAVGKAIWATDWLLMRGQPVKHNAEAARLAAARDQAAGVLRTPSS